MPTFTATALAPGDLGPAQTLKNKSCGTLITVTFGGALTLTPGAGDYTADALWEIFGPDRTTITAMSGPTKDTVAQTFTPDIPGRYLVELNATFFDTGLSSRYTTLIEIKDSQLIDTSSPAANEQQEYAATSGWSLAMQRVHGALGGLMGMRQIVSVTTSGAVLATGETVSPAFSGAWVTQWKGATIDFEHYNNFSMDVEAVINTDAEAATSPILLLLTTVDGTSAIREKGYALARGVINYDTTTIAGVPVAGATIYVGDGVNAFTTAKPAGAPPYSRYVGKIIQLGTDNIANPGIIYFDGTPTAFMSDAFITGKLTVDGLIDPSGLEFTQVVANPGTVAGNTLWMDVATGVLMLGSSIVSLGPSAGSVSLVTVTPHTVGVSEEILLTSLAAPGPVAIQLPLIATFLPKTLTIKDDLGDSGANNITITPDGAETVDGAVSLVISTNGASVTLVPFGSNWRVI